MSRTVCFFLYDIFEITKIEMMKKIMKFHTCLVLAFLSLAIISCDNDDDIVNIVPGEDTLAEVVRTNPDFSILNDALVRTQINLLLSQADGTFTVFAPNDAAFQTFLDANSFESIEDVPLEDLTNLLLNHILNTSTSSTDLTNGYVKNRASNSGGDNIDLYIDVTNGVVLNGGATVTATDIGARNGIIHVVDEVIALPSVVTLAAANPIFSNLVTAVIQENLDGVLSDQSELYTVFAPTNDAFQALVDADPNDALTNVADVLALSNLLEILLYHVVDGSAIRTEDVLAAIEADLTINELVVDPITMGTFTIDTNLQITDGSGTLVTLVVTNVTAANGVVHAIDFVLRPSS